MQFYLRVNPVIRRILSTQNWCDTFIAAYIEDCLEIDQLDESRLQLLNQVLMEDRNCALLAYFDWNIHGNIGRIYQFRSAVLYRRTVMYCNVMCL